MRKVTASGLIFLFITFKLFAQNKMIIDERAGYTVFASYGKGITSLNQLPPNIVDSAKKILNTFLGELSFGTHFEGGQIIDLKAYRMSRDSNRVNRTTPRYELVFVLAEPSIGIKSYPVEIRLDDFGKPLKVDWPRRGYTKKSVFLPVDTVKVHAIDEAEKLGFNKTDYKVEFKYDRKEQKFFWSFLFLAKKFNEHSYNYNVIEINWANVTDFKISQASESTVY